MRQRSSPEVLKSEGSLNHHDVNFPMQRQTHHFSTSFSNPHHTNHCTHATPPPPHNCHDSPNSLLTKTKTLFARCAARAC